MKKLFFIILLLPALLSLVPKDQGQLLLSASTDEQFIDWTAEKRLDWNDFLAQPVKNTDAAALTATHLGFSYSFMNGKVSYDIVCRFDKTKSWGLVKNDWILKHEQGHFDIAEIFARKLNQAVSEYKFNRKTFQRDLDDIYKRIVADKEAYQNEYDTGSDYSRHKRSQNDWLKKIEQDLADTEEWADYR